jgi:hypothetical protein
MESYCEIIAAFKIRTSNKKGRHISTARAIELLEEYGMETPLGFVKPSPGLLSKSTVNYYLKAWGYDHRTMTRQPPAVRFQAELSNECWHFDLSPSDLKQIKQPNWVSPGRGNPQLMLYSVVDDRSGVLAGHPKLKNDLRRPTMEEIGYRTAVFSLDSIGGCQGAYIQWLLKSCTSEGTPLGELIAAEAIDLLSMRLRTPLQIEQHLSLAFEEAHRMGEKTVTEGIVSSILSKQIDDLEPILTRHGYNVKSLSEQFNAKPAEIRSLFRGLLDPVRTLELQEQMLAAGLPI